MQRRAGGRPGRRTPRRRPAARTSSTPTRRPSSADSDVTPASVMPHGTIVANASRSQSQLSAKPCSVVARATRTPMAATLRAGRPSPAGTQTPERPSTRPTCRPTSVQTLISDFLDAPNVIDHVERLGQPDDRVADELARPVPGDLAAAVGVDDRSVVGRPLVGGGAPSRGVDRRVFEQQQRVERRRPPGRRRVPAAAARRPGSRRCPSDGRRWRHCSSGSNSPSRRYNPNLAATWQRSGDIARRGGVAQRLADGVVVELETRPAPARAGMARCPLSSASSANSPSAARIANPGTISGVAPVHRPAQRRGEFGVGDRRRAGEVDRSGQPRRRRSRTAAPGRCPPG